MGEKRGAVESLQIITISQNVQQELSPTTARACFTQAEQEGETPCISVFTIRLGLTGVSVPPYSMNPALKQLCPNYKQKLRLHTYKESNNQTMKPRKSSTFTLPRPQSSCTPQLHWDPVQITHSLSHTWHQVHTRPVHHISAQQTALCIWAFGERENLT